MKRNEFVDLVIKESKNQKWHINEYVVDGEKIGIKQFGKWIQRMEVGGYINGINQQTTQKALREQLEEFLNKVL